MNTETASNWLAEKLSRGVRLEGSLFREGKDDGISETMLLEAKHHLGVQASRTGFPEEKGKPKRYFWELPRHTNQTVRFEYGVNRDMAEVPSEVGASVE